MKKKVLVIILFAIMFLPIISVGATCYRKCSYIKNPSGDCSYTNSCNSVSCTAIDSSKCSGTGKCYNKCEYSNGTKKCSIVSNCGTVSCSAVGSSLCEYNDGSTKLSCGNVAGIPEKIPELTSFAITLIQIAIPIILVVMGSLDLFKGITANKEDEIKKGQQMFVKRLIYAAIIFFVVVVAKLLISVVADSTTSNNIAKCIDCFISGIENCRR